MITLLHLMCFMMSCVLDTTSFFVFAAAARLTMHTLQQNTSHCTEGWSEQQQVHSKVLAKPVSKACQQRTTSVSKEQLGTRTPVSKEQHQALEPARLSAKISRQAPPSLGTRTTVSQEQEWPDQKPWNPHACQQRTTMCSVQNLKTRKRYCYLRGPRSQ